jgi:dUTP pyrophosphatase
MVVHEDEVRIRVMKLDVAAQLPRYAHTGPFGDLAADLYAVAGVTLEAGVTIPVATGVAMEFPSSHGGRGWLYAE